MSSSSPLAWFVPVFTVVERVWAIRPVHFRHAIFAFEEVWERQRTEVQPIACFWMPPNQDRPFGIQNRYMFSFDRQGALCATQAAWSEINSAAGRLSRSRRQIGDGDLRGASGVDGDQQIIFGISRAGECEHVEGIGTVTQFSNQIPANVSTV